jgi:uncharacterized protein (DUF697 family)
VKITVTYCVSIINGKVVQGWAFSAGRLLRKKLQEGTQGTKKSLSHDAARINFEKDSLLTIANL